MNSLSAVGQLKKGRRRRLRRRTLVTTGLAGLTLALFVGALMIGNTFYPLPTVLAVLGGETLPGVSFTVGELRLPRAVIGALAGFAFGCAGATFQTMFRNALAAPDVIGISAGASAAAVTGIVVFSLGDTAVALLALAGALLTAGAIYALAHRGGFAGARLILIGIGFAAVLTAVVSYVLSRAAAWDLHAATQWLTGSLNSANSARVLPLALACLLLVPVLLSQGGALRALTLGDELAVGIGVHTVPARSLLLGAAVALIAVATAAIGPIAFVAFMAGPIASRLAGPDAILLIPAGLVGAVLVLGADLAGQFAFDHRYPAGVITGALGAPFLIYLLIRMNRTGIAI